MGRFVSWVQSLALAFGAPGLFVVAFLDSSFLSLPEINDLLLVWMVTVRKPLMPLYVAMSTAGSIAGCLLLYYLGRKGGEALVTSRFSSTAVSRTLGAFQRHGVMALLIPSLLPPPAPFKIFVLLAGAAKITPGRFIATIAVARGLRYLAEGLLALRYGDQTLEFLHANARAASLAAATLAAAALVGYLLWRKAQTQKSR